MHIITRKKILDFAGKHLDCGTVLDAWYRIMKPTGFSNFVELRNIFPGADPAGESAGGAVQGFTCGIYIECHCRKGITRPPD
jgi:mRNA interferase HigB